MKSILFYSMVLIGLIGCGGGGADNNFIGTSDDVTLTATEENLLNAINNARRQAQMCGATSMPSVPDLDWNRKLALASLDHANDMAKNNYRKEDNNDPTILMTSIDDGSISEVVSINRHGVEHKTIHVGSGTSTDVSVKNDPNYNKSTFIERIKYRGYHFSRAAENITVGNATNTAEKAIERWLNSEGHCKNLMSDQFTEVGMAYVDDENTFYQYYWVQEFGYPQ